MGLIHSRRHDHQHTIPSDRSEQTQFCLFSTALYNYRQCSIRLNHAPDAADAEFYLTYLQQFARVYPKFKALVPEDHRVRFVCFL
jgi:hypothetical protein